MKKNTIIILSITVSVTVFAVLVYFGFRRARGVPVNAQETKRLSLEVPFVDKHIDLSKGIDLAFWDTRPSQEIGLVYQVMVLPWPKARQKETVPRVMVKTFQNGQDIYFYMEWEDSTEDRTVDIDRFTDSCAVMFPLEDNTQTSTLMMGFLGKANIWQWKGSHDRVYWLKESAETEVYVDFYYPFEEAELFVVSKDKIVSAVDDLLAVRVGTVTAKPTQNIDGRGIYDDGMWRVAFRRSLKAADPAIDAHFIPERNLCAFAIWNGSNGDRGGRKSISDWVELSISTTP